jgi:hypothetical protein
VERKRKSEKRKAADALRLLCFSLVVFHFSLLGCGPKNPQAGKKQPYYGPTETLGEVVGAINANNSKLPTLWAHIGRNGFEASFTDDAGKRQDVVLNGMLLYRAPQDVRIFGHQDLLGDVLQIGSNDDLYWVIATEGAKTSWWGRYEFLGAPCAEPVPIRPDLILAVLGVSTINTDLTALPAPVMRFNPDEDAYMLVWNARLPDRWVATKEVWYDRATKRPKFVLLFDENGRVVLRAFLSQHKPVELPGQPQAQWPTVATRYELYFPANNARLRLSLDDVRLSRGGAPNDLTFRFSPNPAPAGVSKVIQLDRNCGQ